MWQKLDSWKEWALVHERQLAAAGLVLGFLWDSFTGSNPGGIFPHVSMLTYFFIAGATIVLINTRGSSGTLGPLPLLTILQFSFGNLASALFVLYSRSGTLVGSGIFVAVLLLLLIGNEFLRGKYTQGHIQVATWFFLFLPYVTLAVPVFLGQVGDIVFIGSGLLGLFIGVQFVVLLRNVANHSAQVSLRRAGLSIVVTYVLFTSAYFLNVIPPVPLSLMHIGMYHTLNRDTSGNYLVTYEAPYWWQIWRDTSTTFTHTAGDTAYCFSAVFAPDNLSTPIFHRWEQYDEVSAKWTTTTYLSFPINGGRNQGYRGYSQSYKLTEGKWRCSVETQRGTLIGRLTFTVVSGIPTTIRGEL